MAALVLEWLDRFKVGTDDVAVPDLEPKLAVIQRLLLDCTYTFLKHAHLFNSVQDIEDDSLITLHHYDFACLIWICPAYVDVSKNVVGIAQRDETNIIAAVSQDFYTNRTDPLRSPIEKVIADGYVAGCQVR